MPLHIDHELRYSYGRPVFIEPMVIRLQPRHDHIQRLIDHAVHVTPSPAGSTPFLDAHDNAARQFWFNATHDHLVIKSTSIVEIQAYEPFDYLISSPETARLPASYPEALAPVLAPFRQRHDQSSAIAAYGDQLARQVGGDTLKFLRELVVAIPNRCAQVHREQGDPWAAAATLERAEGACRDFSVLFTEVCRAVGLASRFVSGYCTAGSLGHVNELHAWAEVYLPGAGWRGYDPTIGVATERDHVVLATAADPANAAPTVGSYRGTGIQSSFAHRVQLSSEPTASWSPGR